MKKLMNDPLAIVDEMIEGYAAAYGKYVKVLPQNKRAVVSASAPLPGKVGIVIGGGAGHEPAFMGLIGRGFADGVPVGNVFASPPPAPILEVTRAINGGAGVLYMYGNYAGDCMNFDMAAELAEMEGIRVATVLVTDDVASAPSAQAHRRRGIAGTFLVFKAAGAAAEKGYDLDGVIRVAQKTNASIRTMGVALSPCAVPQTGKPSFVLGEDEMELGLGIHGEPGIERASLRTADDVADALLKNIMDDMPLEAGTRVAVLVNGLGSTPYMELFLIYRRVAQQLAQVGVTVHRSFVGEYVTSLEMGGCSVSVLKLDDELAELVDAPADTPMYAQHG
ncbi:dihydroxyacetone kinase, N-terminal domain [Paenibacillus sp. UNCCL117]|uniref:dihydroxyacetone kinase subunit DhaK n=1 Tax=unclassified Paenibacillus TaxID=185978 RepID=UPI00088BA767|nr:MULTISPECIES: dihydroxyacetone kinase subunit DhaK [unclassified Paenibacillus]SDD12075.1 dihydroxyacetone kinase DhaK subunit [Paenibacillus sp. cl123]SFW33716.1 dihydroxyacetone kinase, N-terminal domain [Paenibacillus sp. UNCCL117]